MTNSSLATRVESNMSCVGLGCQNSKFIHRDKMHSWDLVLKITCKQNYLLWPGQPVLCFVVACQVINYPAVTYFSVAHSNILKPTLATFSQPGSALTVYTPQHEMFTFEWNNFMHQIFFKTSAYGFALVMSQQLEWLEVPSSFYLDSWNDLLKVLVVTFK